MRRYYFHSYFYFKLTFYTDIIDKYVEEKFLFSLKILIFTLDEKREVFMWAP